ncbi:MAG: bifunctional oligoribonuclease/PAP phosphatase NrnA [Bacteroidales bacterium]|nr:bifunctional oligoribonuclease/PAP phosphatase NrnA [Bacteroidales bacterium]
MATILNVHDVAQLKRAIERADRIVITAHHNPDGDALGSALGLWHTLARMGKPAQVLLPNGFPDFLAWLPGTTSVVRYTHGPDRARQMLNEADVLFCLDFNTFSRAEMMADGLAASPAYKVLVDHHPHPDACFDLSFSFPLVSSTCELVYELLSALYGSSCVGREAALCLYTGIMTDTGSFCYACNSPRTFHVAGELVATGIRVDRVQSMVYNNFSAMRMRMIGHSLLNKMVVLPHKTAYIALTMEEQERFAHRVGDTEGLVNLPLSIKGVAFAALFVQRPDFVKVSLRSRGDFPVNEFAAQHYNGGGHPNAAGGKSFSPLPATLASFEQQVAQLSDPRLLGFRNTYVGMDAEL